MTFRRSLWTLIIVFVSLSLFTPSRAQEKPLGTILASQINVRSEPNADAPILGVMRRGQKFYVSGVDSAGEWLYFVFWGKEAWIRNLPSLVALSVPISELPIASQRAELAPALKVVGSSTAPAIPAPGEPYELYIQLRNDGESAGGFAIAADTPGGFVYAPVPKLDRGETINILLRAPGHDKTGRYKIGVMLDPEQQLTRTIQAWQKTEIWVMIDMAYAAQGRIRLDPETNIDLYGGAADVALTGEGLQAVAPAKIALLKATWGDVHFDALATVEGEKVARADLTSGAVVALQLAEGNRAALRIGESAGESLIVDFVVYEKAKAPAR